MEIIQKGRLPEERPYVGTCHWCKSILRAVKGELEVEPGGFPTYEDLYHGTCPVCGTKVYFRREG